MPQIPPNAPFGPNASSRSFEELKRTFDKMQPQGQGQSLIANLEHYRLQVRNTLNQALMNVVLGDATGPGPHRQAGVGARARAHASQIPGLTLSESHMEKAEKRFAARLAARNAKTAQQSGRTADTKESNKRASRGPSQKANFDARRSKQIASHKHLEATAPALNLRKPKREEELLRAMHEFINKGQDSEVDRPSQFQKVIEKQSQNIDLVKHEIKQTGSQRLIRQVISLLQTFTFQFLSKFKSRPEHQRSQQEFDDGWAPLQGLMGRFSGISNDLDDEIQSLGDRVETERPRSAADASKISDLDARIANALEERIRAARRCMATGNRSALHPSYLGKRKRAAPNHPLFKLEDAKDHPHVKAAIVKAAKDLVEIAKANRDKDPDLVRFVLNGYSTGQMLKSVSPEAKVILQDCYDELFQDSW